MPDDRPAREDYAQVTSCFARVGSALRRRGVGSPAAAATPPSTAAPLTSAQAAVLSQNVGNKVIVVLKNQVPQAPASPSAVATRRNVVAVEQHDDPERVGPDEGTRRALVHNDQCGRGNGVAG